MTLNRETVAEFQEKVMHWWHENRRDLPWRGDPTPYNVLISEVMLQQTQVGRVVPKYLQFIKEFPTIESLANAETRHLLSVWSGLGYNRRALWLREAARQIVELGVFPRTINELSELKGIGPYTSRSILIFAFNENLATVDTNIRRVLIAVGFADEDMTSAQLQSVADQMLLRGRARDWHNALMDYGSAVLTSSRTGIAPVSSQPRFQGSTRQLRGQILKLLTSSESLDVKSLLVQIGSSEIDTAEIEPVLEQLILDGLVERTAQDAYRIAH
jgi:A/G-specific adenine glycosylase